MQRQKVLRLIQLIICANKLNKIILHKDLITWQMVLCFAYYLTTKTNFMIRKTRTIAQTIINLDAEANNETYLLGLAMQLNKSYPIDDMGGVIEEMAQKDYVGKIKILEKYYGKNVVFETQSSELFRKIKPTTKAAKKPKSTAEKNTAKPTPKK